jgi:hypothetical protein
MIEIAGQAICLPAGNTIPGSNESVGGRAADFIMNSMSTEVYETLR